jgi:hypothetical protein
MKLFIQISFKFNHSKCSNGSFYTFIAQVAPLLAIDCSLVSSVKTQKIAGVSVITLQSLMP